MLDASKNRDHTKKKSKKGKKNKTDGRGKTKTLDLFFWFCFDNFNCPFSKAIAARFGAAMVAFGTCARFC